MFLIFVYQLSQIFFLYIYKANSFKFFYLCIGGRDAKAKISGRGVN